MRFSPEKIPIGKGKELIEVFKDYLFLFERVENEVLRVNPNVYLPLKLEEGRPSPLGLFLKSAMVSNISRVLPEYQKLEVWPGQEHRRTALLGRVIFKDKEGRPYRDIDLKGIGHIEKGKIQLPKISERVGAVYGLREKEYAIEEYELAELLLSKGIRTNRILAIVELKDLIVGGEKISLKEARKRGIIPRAFTPVIEIRGFGTCARIDDLITVELSMWERGIRESLRKLGHLLTPTEKEYPLDEKRGENEKSIKRGKILLEDAIKLVSQELNRESSPLSPEEYLQWFAQTLGKNVGLMHREGFAHNNLITNNITLDCRIIDLDTVSGIPKSRNKRKKMIENEIDQVEESLINLKEAIEALGEEYKKVKKVQVTMLFKKGYNSVFKK